MPTLVDSKHYGYALRTGRTNVRLLRRDAAAMLGMTEQALSRIECGADYMPSGPLSRMMTMAYIELARRYLNAQTDNADQRH